MYILYLVYLFVKGGFIQAFNLTLNLPSTASI